MQTYKILTYASLLCGFIGLSLLFLEKIDIYIPKYFRFLGKSFITVGFCLLAFSILSRKTDTEKTKLSSFWILFGIFLLLFGIFFSIKK
jgi:hypothetical protein